jgi:hypothetical protein
MPFFSMDTMPTSLDPLRDVVRELFRQGWQSAESDVPTRDQLADLRHEALAEQVPA